MKKIIVGALVMGAVVLAGTAGVYAAGQGKTADMDVKAVEIQTAEMKEAVKAVNIETVTAVNHFADADGDGICDNIGTSAGTSAGTGQGNQFTDADGNGVCDNQPAAGCPGNGAGQGGCGNGKGNGSNGTGNGLQRGRNR